MSSSSSSVSHSAPFPLLYTSLTSFGDTWALAAFSWLILSARRTSSNNTNPYPCNLPLTSPATIKSFPSSTCSIGRGSCHKLWCYRVYKNILAPQICPGQTFSSEPMSFLTTQCVHFAFALRHAAQDPSSVALSRVRIYDSTVAAEDIRVTFQKGQLPFYMTNQTQESDRCPENVPDRTSPLGRVTVPWPFGGSFENWPWCTNLLLYLSTPYPFFFPLSQLPL